MSNLDEKLNRLLVEAIKKGNYKKADYIIRLGGSVYFLKKRINFVLEKGNDEELEFYAKRVIDLKEKDEFFGGATPLERAIRYKNIKAVKKLVEVGADIESRNSNGSTALIYALWYGNREIMEYLLSKGANINATDRNMQTALHIAVAYKKDKEIVEMLLDNGANIEAGAEDKFFTPLIYAMSKDNEEIVRILLDRGANVNAVDHHGATFLHRVAMCGSLKLFLDVEKLGAQINDVDKLGNNMLMWACDGGNYDVAKELVERGMDVNKEGEWGQTPFIKACYKKDMKLAKLLALNGGDVNIRDTHYDKCALEYLNEEQRIEILKLVGKYEVEPSNEVKSEEKVEEVKSVEVEKEPKKIDNATKSIWARIRGRFGR